MCLGSDKGSSAGRSSWCLLDLYAHVHLDAYNPLLVLSLRVLLPQHHVARPQDEVGREPVLNVLLIEAFVDLRVLFLPGPP